MQILDLLNQDYPSKSIDQNQSKLINMYLEPDKSKGKYQIVAYPTAGLGVFVDTEAANIRAMVEHNEVLYVVAGSKFYSIASDGTKTELGTLNTSTGFAKMVMITGGQDSNNQINIIDGTNGYSYNIGLATAQFPITDVDYPQTATDIASSDEYVIVENNGSISFQISNVADGRTWESLDFASKIGKSDRLVAIYVNQRRLWLFGSKTTEVWYNSGNALFPFERIPDTFLHVGCAAKRSVVMVQEQLMFLGKSINGGYGFYVMNGYVPASIDQPAICYALNQMTTVSDAFATATYKDGHTLIDWTFPTEGRTLTYDATTGIWLEKQSYTSGNYTNFLGSCAAFCYGKSLIGDSNSGKIYYQSTSLYTENSTAVRRIIQTPPVYMNGARIFINRIQIDLETDVGSSKSFTVEKSTDGGRTFTTIGSYDIPAGGGRIYINKIGSARTFVFKISTTADAKFIVLGMQAEAGVGDF